MPYIKEYFGDKRIDLITPAEAAGIRQYLIKDRTAGRGLLVNSSVNRAITDFKAIFRFAVDCGYLAQSPFDRVKGGKTTNPDRQYYVTSSDIQSAIDICNQVELKGILAFARFAGLRIPSEIRDLKFSDFEHTDGGIIFRVPNSGKTGTRRVPLFDELLPYFNSLKVSAVEGQEYVFEKYRTCKNTGTLIKKKMERSGLPIWEKFFVNMRSSCITDKERLGWTRSLLDAVFGNSEGVRLAHYIQPLPDNDYAALGRSLSENAGPKKVPVDFPDFPPETDDPAELQKWSESVAEKFFCRPFGLSMSGKELLDEWGSSYELCSATNELNALTTTVFDFYKGKISAAEADKRVDDHSYRAMFFRDDYLKKSLREPKEKRDEKAPEVGGEGLEPPTFWV